MRRHVLLAAALLILAGCSDDPPPPVSEESAETQSDTEPAEEGTTAETTSEEPTPDPEAELAEAQAMARTLYYDYSQVWQSNPGGTQQAAQFWAENNHPEMAYTVEECRTFLDTVVVNGASDFRESVIPDVSSMALDPGWSLSVGRYQGLVPSGTTYILTVTTEVDVRSEGYSDEYSSQVHITVLDGRAYFFIPCEES